MGLVVKLETESGETVRVVEDREDMLLRMLPATDDAEFVCLRFVDPYQDTVFNQKQLRVVAAELERLAETANAQQRTLIEEVRELALEGAAEPHLYMKFYGE